jgi:hypothetical protein
VCVCVCACVCPRRSGLALHMQMLGIVVDFAASADVLLHRYLCRCLHRHYLAVLRHHIVDVATLQGSTRQSCCVAPLCMHMRRCCSLEASFPRPALLSAVALGYQSYTCGVPSKTPTAQAARSCYTSCAQHRYSIAAAQTLQGCVAHALPAVHGWVFRYLTLPAGTLLVI